MSGELLNPKHHYWRIVFDTAGYHFKCVECNGSAEVRRIYARRGGNQQLEAVDSPGFLLERRDEWVLFYYLLLCPSCHRESVVKAGLKEMPVRCVPVDDTVPKATAQNENLAS